jgi:laminin beta 4
MQGLIGLAVNKKDKGETQPDCEVDLKDLRENMSTIEKILKQPIFLFGELVNVRKI